MVATEKKMNGHSVPVMPTFTNDNDIVHEFEEISPAVAKTLLENNHNNRSINISAVKLMAQQMKRGQWKMAADPIRVGTTGRLLDGQHRLSAIIMSDTTQTMLMVYNLPEDTFDVMDTGRVRQAADVLQIDGIPNPKIAAALVRLIVGYEQSLYNVGKEKTQTFPLTNLEIRKYMQTHDLNEFINRALGWSKTKKIFTTPEYALYYYILAKVSQEHAILFLNAVSSGVKLEQDSPMYVLREKLIKYKEDHVTSMAKERLGLTIKAWNLYRSGNTVKMLVFDPYKHDVPTPV